MTTISQVLVVPRRPGYGHHGRRIQLISNFFTVKSIPRDNIIHFDVQITPSGLPKTVNRMVMEALFAKFSREIFMGVRPAYDGESSFFMPRELPFKSRTEVIKIDNRRDEFTVKIEQVGVINMQNLHLFLKGEHIDMPQDCIQALDVVLRTQPSVTCSIVGSSFFSGKQTASLGGGGAEIWKGFYQSLRPAHGRLLVNLDTAACCFYIAQPLLDLVSQTLKCRDLRQLSVNDRRAIEKEIKGLKIEVTHRGEIRRKYRLSGVAKDDADSLSFDVEGKDGGVRRTNVTKYFKERYGLELKYPRMPLVKCGSSKNPTFLPMEVCKIVGGERVTKKLSPAQTACMIKQTATKPDMRRQLCETMFKERDYHNDESAQAFGLDVGKEQLPITGRVIPAPRIIYNQDGGNPVVEPGMGCWQFQGSKFYNARSIERWGVFVLADRLRDNDITDFVQVLCRHTREVGMEINRNPVIVYPNRNSSCHQDSIMHAVSVIEQKFNGPPQMLLVVLPTTCSKTYGEIKRVCDTVVDIPSQCMLSKHVQKKNAMYCRNIMLKLNIKMGGVNNVIDRTPSSAFLFSKPAIVFGADVSHAAPGSSQPSFSAVVASMDAYPYRYETQVRPQTSRQEMIADLKDMSRDLLMSFYRATGGKKPEKILFYRDGVSEGQFDKVLRTELTALREACLSLEDGYTPTITFVIVQKRHHARFFCKNRADADRSGNVPPGTVVDTDIVHPRQFDFYLVSHSGIQGTSRPCHYHVLWDENNFTADILQQFTYQQCFLFGRCTRSVSVVPAVYYAHLAAFRARHHSKADDFDSPSSSDGSFQLSLPQVKPNNRNIMYFL